MIDDDLTVDKKAPQGRATRSAVFPLANSLLFPHAVQALYIFEPRYIEMVKQALMGDKLISMALLKPGYEEDYYGAPEVYSTACLGRIIDHRELPGERYQVALEGLAAVDLNEELEGVHGFRVFEVLQRDFMEDLDSTQQFASRKILYELLKVYFLLQSGLETDPESLCADMNFSTLVDNICFLIPLDSERKMNLLRSLKVSERSFLLQSYLEQEIKLMKNLKFKDRNESGSPLGPFYPRGAGSGGPIVHDV